MQGIETVRRDNCLLVRKMVTVVLDKLLKERDPDGAVAHVKMVIADLLMNRVDMSDLVVSKSLSQVRCPPLSHVRESPETLPQVRCSHSPCSAPICAGRTPPPQQAAGSKGALTNRGAGRPARARVRVSLLPTVPLHRCRRRGGTGADSVAAQTQAVLRHWWQRCCVNGGSDAAGGGGVQGDGGVVSQRKYI